MKFCRPLLGKPEKSIAAISVAITMPILIVQAFNWHSINSNDVCSANLQDFSASEIEAEPEVRPILDKTAIPPLYSDKASYLKALKRKIAHNWYPPKMGEWHTPVATFRLDAAGNLIKEPRILAKNNRIERLEESCLWAIKKAGPFGPLPADMHPNQVITITFDYAGLIANTTD